MTEDDWQNVVTKAARQFTTRTAEAELLVAAIGRHPTYPALRAEFLELATDRSLAAFRYRVEGIAMSLGWRRRL